MVDVLAAGGLAIVMYYGATRVMSGDLSTGDVIVFFAYVTNLYSPMKALSKLSYALGKAAVGAERVAEVMHQRSEVMDRENAVTARGFLGRIEFRNVEFEYKYGQSIVSEINLTIAPGETVAIVGATGAGKSTLISLVPRFYDPTGGVVLLDGKDIRNFQVQRVLEQFLEQFPVQDWLDVTIEEVVRTEHVQVGRGRPGPDTLYRQVEVKYYTIGVASNEAALQRAARGDRPRRVKPPG